MRSGNWKIKSFFLIFIFLSFSVFVFAQALEIKYPTIPGIPALSEKPLLPEYVRYLYYFSIIISGLIAFASLVYGGFRYLISVGDPVVMADARAQIAAGVIGLIIILSSYLLLTTINPQLAIFRLPALKANCDCSIDYGSLTEECKKICLEVPGVNYPTITYTSYEVPLGTLIEKLLEEQRLSRIRSTAKDMRDLAKEVQDKAHDLADALSQCKCSNLTSSCAEGCADGHCEGDPCPNRTAQINPARAALLAAAQNLQNYIEGEPLTILDKLKKDITRLEIAKVLVQEAIAPINYDNYLEIKELALAMEEDMKVVSFYALGEVTKAAKNDPVTFYISEEEFTAIQEKFPYILNPGLDPNTLATCDECQIDLYYTNIDIPPETKEELASQFPNSKIKNSCPDGLDCWDYVIKTAKDNSFNPVLLLAQWGAESHFSQEDAYDLGCTAAPRNNLLEQLDCWENTFADFRAGGDPNCRDGTTEFCAYIRRWSSDPLPCSLANNSSYFPNVFSFYTQIIPPDSPAVPSGNCTQTVQVLPPGAAGCPLNPNNEFCITCNWHGYCRPDGYCHDGIDLSVPVGIPVYAVADGIIAAHQGDGKGNYILLYTNYGVFMYAHLDSFADLSLRGSRPVTKGALIGYSGCTGTDPCAPHLHFAYYVDTTINSSNARPVECLGINCINSETTTCLVEGCAPFSGCP